MKFNDYPYWPYDFFGGNRKKPVEIFQAPPKQFQNQSQKVTRLQHILVRAQTGNAPV